MNTTLNFILAGAVTLTCAVGVIGGEAAKGELRLVEAATSISAGSGTSELLASTPTAVATVR
ncbi:hypothetical protein [Variovorax sp. Sphag1AA]|uniref:hypothetical protein n=1 Tax=Variovorax sp. Sphag1AA TaxID=2587027 RepID=UPI00161AC83B|nr:hypothetical protein [Variovorax sp. Sphag1AA]MBB3178060.1 hypothetical protein [Variovorax sp. Sphag1AA]MBO9651135.1 hypothetical protein [Variovorax sp.]